MLIPYFETSPSRSLLFFSVTNPDCFLPTFFAVLAPAVDVGDATGGVVELSIFLLTLSVELFVLSFPFRASSFSKFFTVVFERLNSS